jgi:hypothetical protein
MVDHKYGVFSLRCCLLAGGKEDSLHILFSLGSLKKEDQSEVGS